MSRQLKVHKHNCPAQDLQLAAVVLVLKLSRHYLNGVGFEIFIDHKSLQHVMSHKDLNSRQYRWIKVMKD